jgi:hypothetical protein
MFDGVDRVTRPTAIDFVITCAQSFNATHRCPYKFEPHVGRRDRSWLSVLSTRLLIRVVGDHQHHFI